MGISLILSIQFEHIFAAFVSDGTVKSFQKISDTEGSFTATLDDSDRFGGSIANIGDLDNDGVTDLIVGVDGDDDGGDSRGAVYVLFMNTDGTVKSFQKISDTEGSFTATLDNSDGFGFSVAGIGDLDNDGVEDIAVGAINDGDGGASRGAVYVLFMNTDGTVKSFQKISDTEGSFTATLDNDDNFGTSVGNIGDLDNDGVTDLIVGTSGDDDGGSNRGAAYVLFMKTDGTVKSFQKISDTDGSFTATLDNFDQFGSSLSRIGDLDNDGVTDFVVGAHTDDDGGSASDRGAAYVLFMKTDGTVKSFQKISDTEGSFTATLDNGDNFGRSIANIGDLDNDGVTDFVVGAFKDDDGGTDRGAVYVLFLNGNVIEESTSSGGGKPKGDISAPSFSLDKFTLSQSFPEHVLDTIQDDPYTPIEPIKDQTLDLPLVINENGYAISKYTNTILTNTIETGNPINLKLNLDDETGIEHVALYTNLREDKREIQDSDTYILFDEYKELEIVDPHQLFSFANVTVYENNTKYSINFNITFAKPMEKSDIIFRIWDDRRNMADTKILDAWQIVGDDITKEEPFSLLLAEPAVKEAESSEFSLFDEEKNRILDEWAGYYAEQASNSRIFDMLGLEGDYIPHWVKQTFGEGIHDGVLEVDDLRVALEYLIKIKVVK